MSKAGGHVPLLYLILRDGQNNKLDTGDSAWAFTVQLDL